MSAVTILARNEGAFCRPSECSLDLRTKDEEYLFGLYSHSILLLTQEIFEEILGGNIFWSRICRVKRLFPHFDFLFDF